MDVRKAFRRFSGFMRGNGKRSTDVVRPWYADRDNPFWEFPMFRKTRDGRHVVALNIYPRLHTRALNFLRGSDSSESVNNAILQWRADELEAAGQEAGLVFAKIRTNEEFLKEPQYTEVLSKMPLITLEKIGESEPVPFKRGAKSPLEGIRAFGMGHVIAGGASAETSPTMARTSSTSGNLMIRKLRPLSGTCRLGCAPRYWMTTKKIAPSSIAC